MAKYRMKEDLKKLVSRIRNGKSGRKPKFRDSTNTQDHNDLVRLCHQARHLHIAHCLLRGREMKQIERPREDNQPSDATIFKYIQEYRPDGWKIDFVMHQSKGLIRQDPEEMQEAA